MQSWTFDIEQYGHTKFYIIYYDQIRHYLEIDQDTLGSESIVSFNTAEDSSQVSLTVSDQNPEILALAVHNVHNPASNLAEPSSGVTTNESPTSNSDMRLTNQFKVPNLNQFVEAGIEQLGPALAPKLVIHTP